MAKKRNERLGDTVESLRPYIERALRDDEFRGNVREAVRSEERRVGKECRL